MNILKKLLLNAENKISWMKLGGQVVAVAGVVLTLPTMGVTVPIAVLTVAKIAIAVGGAIGISGARDAMEKKPIEGK